MCVLNRNLWRDLYQYKDKIVYSEGCYHFNSYSIGKMMNVIGHLKELHTFEGTVCEKYLYAPGGRHGPLYTNVRNKPVELGKVYFAETGWLDKMKESDYSSVFGLHAYNRASHCFTFEANSNEVMPVPVMVASIFAKDNNELECGVMLYFTESDYRTYFSDTHSRPINLETLKIDNYKGVRSLVHA